MPSDAAESWFLTKGLPAVLKPRDRARHLLSRSAPALAAYATVVIALLVVYYVTGSSEIYIDGPPTPAERVVLGVVVLTLPLAVFVGRTVSRLNNRRIRSAVALAASGIAAIAGVVQGGPSHLVGTLAVIAIVLVLTATGVGAVLGWAIRLTMRQAAAMGALFVRALPVVLLTVVVFLNPFAWLLASTLSRARLGMALLLLFAVTTAFIVSASRNRVESMLESVSSPHEGVHDLTGTPFAGMPDRQVDEPLTRGERVNVGLVLAAAQIAHLMMIAISTAAIYFVLGLIVLSPALLARWTENATRDGTILGMTIPVPQSLIHMTLILGALTFMYVSARSTVDEEYKRDFLSPLVEDLHSTLIARGRYRDAH